MTCGQLAKVHPLCVGEQRFTEAPLHSAHPCSRPGTAALVVTQCTEDIKQFPEATGWSDLCDLFCFGVRPSLPNLRFAVDEREPISNSGQDCREFRLSLSCFAEFWWMTASVEMLKCWRLQSEREEKKLEKVMWWVIHPWLAAFNWAYSTTHPQVSLTFLNHQNHIKLRQLTAATTAVVESVLSIFSLAKKELGGGSWSGGTGWNRSLFRPLEVLAVENS